MRWWRRDADRRCTWQRSGAEENLTFGDGRIIARAMSMTGARRSLVGIDFQAGAAGGGYDGNRRRVRFHTAVGRPTRRPRTRMRRLRSSQRLKNNWESNLRRAN